MKTPLPPEVQALIRITQDKPLIIEQGGISGGACIVQQTPRAQDHSSLSVSLHTGDATLLCDAIADKLSVKVEPTILLAGLKKHGTETGSGGVRKFVIDL